MRDVRRIGLVVVVLMLLLLIVFLRAVIAPIYLVAVSLLAFFASLGITAYVFREVFGVVTMSSFVPFASAVLLISLGSDYNIFLVGRIGKRRRGARYERQSPSPYPTQAGRSRWLGSRSPRASASSRSSPSRRCASSPP